MFVRFLKIEIKRISGERNISIDSIPKQIWYPTFEHCENLLDSLVNLTIEFAKVDKHFQDFKKDLDTQVFNLAYGVWECQNAIREDGKLHIALDRVKEYWKFCEYRDVADVFLELKEALQLQGDFKIVQNFSLKVNFHRHLFTNLINVLSWFIFNSGIPVQSQP